MEIYIYKNGQRSGPFSFEAIRKGAADGSFLPTDLAWYEGCTDWIDLGRIPGLFTTPPSSPPPIGRPARSSQAFETSDETLIRRISDYERISGIIWIVFGALQICTIYLALAGAWNIYAGIACIGTSKRILERDARIPKAFEGIGMLVAFFVINLIFGGVIGILFVAFDFYIRDLILKNAHLFTATRIIAYPGARI